MTIGIFSLYVGIAAIICTLVAGLLFKRVENWAMSFLQFFAGILFVVSGWVKAIDPLGTAYKMEQYFAAFEGTFKDTAMSWISPVFPFFAEYSEGFAVAMIVFEIVLGIGIFLGYQRKLMAWLFLLLVVFFTILTGFTFLTGFVPSDANFFDFSQWGPFVDTNMKVTDCGCFGDFMKLDPRISFSKDLILLVPSFLFIFFHRKMHQLFGAGVRTWAVALSIPVFLVYCFSNYVWDLPHTDFRPFKVGVNIKEKKAQELEAGQNVKILAYHLKNKKNGKELEIPFDQFLKEMANYPAEEWEMEQIKSKPAILPTKISEFDVMNLDGDEVTEELLSLPGYNFLLIAHHLEGGFTTRTVMIPDTIYKVDTVRTANSTELVRSIDRIGEKNITQNTFSWSESYLKRWKEVQNPVMEAAMKDGLKVVAIVAFGSREMIEDFKQAAGITYPVLVADDILLKTIVRSNPGTLLMNNGTIVQNWHFRRLPDYSEIKKDYIK